MTPTDDGHRDALAPPWTDAGAARLLDDRRCRATSKRTGLQCGRYPVPGGRVCHMHGGATRAAKAAAARNLAEREGARLLGQIWNRDAAPVEQPVLAMQKLAGQMTQAVDVLGERLNDEDQGLDGATASAWGRVLRELRQLLVSMEHLGIAERAAELEKEQARIVVLAFRAALAMAGRDLLPAVQEEMTTVFLAELRAEDARSSVVRGEVG